MKGVDFSLAGGERSGTPGDWCAAVPVALVKSGSSGSDVRFALLGERAVCRRVMCLWWDVWEGEEKSHCEREQEVIVEPGT